MSEGISNDWRENVRISCLKQARIQSVNALLVRTCYVLDPGALGSHP